jgi:hypothetical protein
MSVSRFSQSSLQNGFIKYNELWDGRTAVGSMEAIGSITLTSDASTITFQNIPATFKDLHIRCLLRTNRSGTTDATKLTFNNDSGANYSMHGIYASGAGSPAAQGYANYNWIWIERAAGNTAAASTFGALILDVVDYQNTNKFKTVRSLGGIDLNGSGEIYYSSGNWRNSVNAISSFTFAPNVGTTFVTGSTIFLYGVK